MNLTEAKKLLNKKGYLLEDRFGGGKDRYGHKIKRIKLSDLGDLDDEPANGEDLATINPTDIEPEETVTPNEDFGTEKITLDNIERTETTNAFYKKPKKVNKIEVELTEDEQNLIYDLIDKIESKTPINTLMKIYGGTGESETYNKVLKKFSDEYSNISVTTNNKSPVLLYDFIMPWHWDDYDVKNYNWEKFDLPYRDLLIEKAKEFSKKTKLFDIKAYPDEEYYDDNSPAIFSIELLLYPKQDKSLYTGENIEKELRNIHNAYNFDIDLNNQAYHNVMKVQELAGNS